MRNFDLKVSGYELDSEQKEVVISNSKNILVIAGAGSGKSLTIIGKIKYLTEKQKVKEDEILCVSFTNDSCESLRNNIKKNNHNIEVLTFHKLALKILKTNKINVSIAPSDLLEYIVEEFFNFIIIENPYYIFIVLKYLKIKFNKSNYEKKYQEIISNDNLKVLQKLICTFIHLYKSNGYNYNYLEKIFMKEKHRIFNKNNLYFLNLVIKILYEYTLELNSNSQVDFDDMISMATTATSKNNNLKYKYIIIDEFQDTSLLRYNLIKEILNKTNASFLAVGDDYQSIYRFTGCDLSLFLNFEKYFNGVSIYKIQTTYRNSIELITDAGKFIQKNNMQIKKKLKSNKHKEKPIKIVYYKNQSHMFNKLIEYLYKQGKKGILILGRNNNDINKVLNSKFVLDENGNIKHIKYNDLKLKFLTVHRSKGLEEKNVIILSLEDNIWGFPNKKEDDNIFKYVLPKKEKYPYSEERRLFYVALTRTKNEVFLLVNKKKPSIFVKEILRKCKNVDLVKLVK